MAKRQTTPSTYLDRLLAELEEIHASYVEVLAGSAIINIDPNRRPGTGAVFIGFPKWGWAASDAALERARMALLRRVRDWEPRFRLLFPHPTPTVSRRLDEHIGRLKRWLVRKDGEHIPPTVEKAAETIHADVVRLGGLADLLPADEYATRLTVDTNTLIDNPDLAVHAGTLGRRYVAHLLPVVLGELDELKRAGRTQELREAAWRADRRLKGLRANGDVRVGVRVAGDIHAVFEHVEPRGDRLPSWLDLTVPDDRFVASCLLLQSEHPRSALFVATSDINLQTKLSAVGLPFIELAERN